MNCFKINLTSNFCWCRCAKITTTIIILFLMVVLSFSCSNTNNENKSKDSLIFSKFKLTGKVYFFGPRFDSIKCEIDAGCDCCSDNILFINDSNFVHISYCMDDDSYYKGKYIIHKDKVILKYDTFEVSKKTNFDNDDEVNQTTPFLITTSKSIFGEKTLKRFDCKKTICFIIGDEEQSYGAIDKYETLSNLTSNLKNEGIWEKLFSVTK